MRTEILESSTTVPGGRLRFLTRGSGPLLLLVAGGHGDATKSAALAGHLAEHNRGCDTKTAKKPDAWRDAVLVERAQVFALGVRAALRGQVNATTEATQDIEELERIGKRCPQANREIQNALLLYATAIESSDRRGATDARLRAARFSLEDIFQAAPLR